MLQFTYHILILSFLSLFFPYLGIAQQDNTSDSLSIQKQLDYHERKFTTHYLDGAYEDAIQALQKIIEIADLNNKKEESASASFFIAYCHFERRDYLNMDSVLQTTLIYCQKNQLSDSTQVYTDINYLYGKYHYRLGNFESALFYYQNVIERLSYSKFGFFKNDVYNNLALVFNRNGDYQKAYNYYLKTFREINISNLPLRNKARCLQNIGRNFFKWGYYSSAFDSYQQALTILLNQKKNRNNNLILARVYNNLGEYYGFIEKYDSAHYYLNLASVLNPTKLILINNLQKKSSIFIKEEQFDSVAIYLDSALNSNLNYYRTNKHPEIAETYQFIGESYFSKQQYNKSLKYYQKALVALSQTFQDSTDYSKNPEDFQEISSKVYLFKTLRQKGHILKTIGQFSYALNAYQVAGNLIETMLKKYLITEESRYFWLEQARPIYESIIELAILLDQKELAWEYAQKGHAVLLMQSLQDLKAKNIGGIPDSLIKVEQQLKIEIATNEKKQLDFQGKKDIKAIGELSKLLFEQKQELEKLQTLLEKNYPVYYQYKYDFSEHTSEEMQKILPDKNTAFIEYFVGSQSLFTFVATKNQAIEVYKQPINAQFFENIKGFQESTTKADYNINQYGIFCRTAHGLYQTLLEKPLNDLPPQVKNLIIIPDDQLSYLSFAALLTEVQDLDEEGINYFNLPYLIKMGYNISYSYSAAVFATFKKKKKLATQKTLLGMAPMFRGNRATGRNLDSLLYNIEEVLILNNILGGDTLLRENATLSAFKERLKFFKIAHFSTHAICNDTLPLSSQIYFYQDSMPIYEIFNLAHELDLAVLSVCDAGSGQLKKGEGIISLARAFMQSGCPSVVTSLWQVNDRQAPQLMEDFYVNLKNGRKKNIALSEAQRTYLLSTDGHSLDKDMHPFYWATFVQIGDIQPVFPTSFWNKNYLLFAFFLLLFLAFFIRLVMM